MTNDTTVDLEQQQQALHDYSPDADDAAIISDYDAVIVSCSLSSADEATMEALIEQNVDRIGENQSAATAALGVSDTLADIGLYTAGSGLKTVSAAITDVISDLGAMSGTDTIGERIASWAMTNLAPTAKIAAADLATVGGALTEHAGDIAIYSAVSEVLHSDHPALTGLEAGTALGVGVAVMAAALPEEAGASLGTYALASLQSGLAATAVSEAWTAINSSVAYGQAHGWSIDAMAAAAQSDFDSAYAAIMGSTGSTATANLTDIASSSSDITGAMGQAGGDLMIAPPLESVVADAVSKFALAITTNDPLVIDVSSGHSGITLTSFDASSTTTLFDMTNSGFAQQTAWTSGDTGFLVDDLNSNGKIDNVGEMFGTNGADGFAQLAAFDSNHDLKIDSNDAGWSSLQIWIDANGDGITESGELHSLSSAC